MSRGSRLRVLLGACIVGTIGVVTQSTLLTFAAVALLIFSCVRYKSTPATNYTEKFGPPDNDEPSTTGLGSMMAERALPENEDDDRLLPEGEINDAS